MVLTFIEVIIEGIGLSVFGYESKEHVSLVQLFTLTLVLYISRGEENRKNIEKYFSIAFIVSAMMLGFGTAQASEIQYRVKMGIQDRYVNKAGMVLYDAPIIQSEVVANLGGLYAGLSSMTSLGSEKYGKFGKELDINFGYKRTIGSGQFWNPTFDLTLSYYILGDWTTVSDDRFIADFRIEFAKVPVVQPYVAFRYFGSVGEASKDGEFFWLGLKRDQLLGIRPFGGEISLRVDGSFAFATQGSMGRDGGYIFSRIQTSLNIPLSKKFSLNSFYMVQIPAGDQNGVKGDFVSGVEQVFGGFVSARF